MWFENLVNGWMVFFVWLLVRFIIVNFFYGCFVIELIIGFVVSCYFGLVNLINCLRVVYSSF